LLISRKRSMLVNRLYEVGQLLKAIERLKKHDLKSDIRRNRKPHVAPTRLRAGYVSRRR